MASLHPSYGVRIVLEREAGEGVRYRVSIYEPVALHTAIARVDGYSFTAAGWPTTESIGTSE